MSDNTNTNTETKATGKAPTHVAYQVRDREGQKSFWTRIAALPGRTPMAKASTSSWKSCPSTAASASASLRRRKSKETNREVNGAAPSTKGEHDHDLLRSLSAH